MARVFLSYASEDTELANEVFNWLTDAQRGDEVFRYTDRFAGIRGGDAWQIKLHEKLRWADAVICLISEAYINSMWCTVELAIAQSRGSRVLPIRAQSGASHPMLIGVQYIKMNGHDAGDVWLRISDELRRSDAIGGAGWPDDRTPFPGLEHFTREDHLAFFGRSAEVDELAAMLRSPAERADESVIMVVGPSGSGKSSLVHAGLTPVMASEHDWIVLPAILPGSSPLASFAAEFAIFAKRQFGWTCSPDAIHSQLVDDPQALVKLVIKILSTVPNSPVRHALLIVDQVEELISTGPTSDTRDPLWDLIAATSGSTVHVVGTLRPEFLVGIQSRSATTALKFRVYSLMPLRNDVLPTIITGPADLANFSVSDELVTRLVQDTGSGEALPLLAYTLQLLSVGVSRGGEILEQRYEDMGGVQGALRQAANKALAAATRCSGRTPEQVLRDLLLLVSANEENQPTRRRVRRSEFSDQFQVEIEEFIDERLMTTTRAPTTETTHHRGDNDGEFVWVTHQAFLSSWEPLAQEIRRNSAALRARRLVHEAAAVWDSEGTDNSRLWGAQQFDAALLDLDARSKTGATGWHRYPRYWRIPSVRGANWRVPIGKSEESFLTAVEKQIRTTRNLAAIAVLVVFTLLAGTALYAYTKRENAIGAQRIATARELVAQADNNRSLDPRDAIKLGLAAARLNPSPESVAGLVASLENNHIEGALQKADDRLSSIAVAPTGRFLATGSWDHSVYLWDVSNHSQPKLLGRPLIQTSGVFSVAVSSDGELLAVGTEDGQISMWNLADPDAPTQISGPLQAHSGIVHALAFAPGKPLLVSGGFDNKLRLWDVSDPSRVTPLGEFSNNKAPVVSATFLPDGQAIASGSWDGTASLWDISNLQHPVPIGDPMRESADRVNSVAVSSDGKALAVASWDGTVTLWNVANRLHPVRSGLLSTHSGRVFAAAFSPDGKTVATGGSDGKVLLWNVAELGKPPTSLAGHTAQVNSLAFLDSKNLVSASYDMTAIVWSVSAPATPVATARLAGQQGRISAASFAKVSGIVATSSWDGTVWLWNLHAPNPMVIARVRASQGPILAATFSPDGKILAVGGSDRSFSLWDLSAPAYPRLLSRPEAVGGAIHQLTFASDGRQLAVADLGADNAKPGIQLWDISDKTNPALASALQEAQPVYSIAFLGGHLIADAEADGTIRLWDITNTHRPNRSSTALKRHTDSVYQLAVSPDGKTLASGSADGKVQLWSVAEPTSPYPLGPPLVAGSDLVYAVTFSPDGNTLAIGSSDGSTTLEDLSDMAHPRVLGTELVDRPGAIHGLSYSANGTELATSSLDGTTTIWDLADQNSLRANAVAEACRLNNGSLTPDEWRRSVLDIDYMDTCSAR